MQNKEKVARAKIELSGISEDDFLDSLFKSRKHIHENCKYSNHAMNTLFKMAEKEFAGLSSKMYEEIISALREDANI